MNENIKYITENYIELEELCVMTNLLVEDLERLIAEKLLPNYSYKTEITTEISSPLQDKEVVKVTKKYFPKSIVNLIEQNLNEIKENDLKKKIKNEFINTFITHNDNKFAYESIVYENGIIDKEKLAEAFEIEWEYYLKGIYGICTLNATGSEIAKKEIAVKKLISFIKKNEKRLLQEDTKKELLLLNTQYNEVSNLFAPYQRKNSSRGKYLDKVLEGSLLNELIKKYNKE